MEQTIKITDCDNGIYAVFQKDGEEEFHLVFPNETKNKQFGMFLLSDVREFMNAKFCNKVKITMTIEPITEE